MPDKKLCLVVCGAGPARQVGVLVSLAQHDGWSVGIVATPSATRFLDMATLEAQSGSPVRTDYRADGRHRSGGPDAVVVAPATYNTINKLALGVNDNYALNVVAEAIGRHVPIAILPFVNSALAARRPFADAVGSLRAEGVHVIFGPQQWTPHPPGSGEQHIADFPWSRALAGVTG